MGLPKVKLKELRRTLCPHCGGLMYNSVCTPCLNVKTFELRLRKKELQKLKDKLKEEQRRHG